MYYTGNRVFLIEKKRKQNKRNEIESKEKKDSRNK